MVLLDAASYARINADSFRSVSQLKKTPVSDVTLNR